MVMRQNLISTFFQMYRRDKKTHRYPMCLHLTKCTINRLPIIRFAGGFDTLCNVMLNTQVCKKKNFLNVVKCSIMTF